MAKAHATLDSRKLMKSTRSADRQAGNLMFYDINGKSNIHVFQEDYRDEIVAAFDRIQRADKVSGERHLSPIGWNAAGGVLETPELRVHIAKGAVLGGRIALVVLEDKATGFNVILKGESDKHSLSGGSVGFLLPAENPIEALNQIVEKWTQFMETMRRQHPGDTDYRGGVLTEALGKMMKPMDLLDFDKKFVEPVFGAGQMDLPAELRISGRGRK